MLGEIERGLLSQTSVGARDEDDSPFQRRDVSYGVERDASDRHVQILRSQYIRKKEEREYFMQVEQRRWENMLGVPTLYIYLSADSQILPPISGLEKCSRR